MVGKRGRDDNTTVFCLVELLLISTRFTLNRVHKHGYTHTHIRTPWKNSGKFKTKTSRIRSESNFPIARFGGTVRKYAKHSNYKSSTCFNFICAIFKHNAENVLFTTCSSTSRAHMNGIKMESERIHSSFFFTPDTHHVHLHVHVRLL